MTSSSITAGIGTERSAARPKVSVIAVFRDNERFFSETIESVLAQDFQDVELILVDDGSTDGSTTIARRYESQCAPVVRYLEHPRHDHRGMSASRNLGLSAARGEFIAFIDAGDVWEHVKLTEQLQIMEAYPNLGMSCGAVRYWSSWNGGSDRIAPTGHIQNRVILPPEAALALYPLARAGAPRPSDLLLRRDVVAAVGGFEERFTGPHQLYEDQGFLAKLYLAAPVYFSDRVWLNHRLHRGSCEATVIREGRYHEVRLHFLKWFQDYLSAIPEPDPRVTAALQRVLSHYGRPTECTDGSSPPRLPPLSNRALAAAHGISIREVKRRRRHGYFRSTPTANAVSQVARTAQTGATEMTEGFLEVITLFRLSGWAVWDGKPAELGIFVNGERIGAILCDRRRPDIARRGLSENSGFEFLFSDRLNLSDVVAVRFSDGTLLAGSQRQPALCESGLDECTARRVAGWAVYEGAPATLTIAVNAEPVALIRCDKLRPDLAVGTFPGRAGFEYFFPRPLGSSDELSICFENGENIEGSPCRPGLRYQAPRITGGRDNRPITIVLGMHRSGTSLCASVLNLVGIDMSDDIEVTAANQRGHWEQKALVAYHDRVLAVFGRDWFDPRHALSLPGQWWADPAVRRIRDEMIEWLAQRLRHDGNFGFKDPRAARLLPLWDEICSALEIEARYVFCVRNPAQVARSVAARDTIDPREAEYRWMVYNSHAILNIGERPVCIVPYESWFDDAGANLATLAAHLGPAWALSDPVLHGLVSQTIDPGLRHDHAGADEASGRLSQKLYREILDCVPHGHFDRAALDGASDFAAFEELIEPVLAASYAERPMVVLREPAPSSAKAQYPDPQLRLAGGMVQTIYQYAQALQEVLGELQPQPRGELTQADEPDLDPPAQVVPDPDG